MNNENKERRAYYKELNNLLTRGESVKNLYLYGEGFPIGPSGINNLRERARRGNATAKFVLRKYYERRKNFVDFVMNNGTPMSRPEKKRLIERILTDKRYNPTKEGLKKYGFK